MSGGPISAPERWTFEELASAGWREADLAWETTSDTAMERLAAGDVRGACDRIAETVRMAHAEFAVDDPRLGTSLANHCAALAATGEAHLAGRSRKDAIAIWKNCDGWIARMTAPRVARSSLFHMRMEQRHRAAYEDRWRVKWAELAAEARETTGDAAPLELISAEQAVEWLSRWRRERPAMLNDTRKLMGAAMLLVCRRP